MPPLLEFIRKLGLPCNALNIAPTPYGSCSMQHRVLCFRRSRAVLLPDMPLIVTQAAGPLATGSRPYLSRARKIRVVSRTATAHPTRTGRNRQDCGGVSVPARMCLPGRNRFGVREIVSVPAKRPIKPVYIRQFLTLIDNALEVLQDDNKNKPKP